MTFLLSDIEGSTRLWEAHPDAMRLAVPQHYELLAQAVARHDGVRPVEQGEGDSIVAAFSRASDALAAALEAQLALHAQQWPDGIDLGVRIALHTAEAQLRDEGNYFGVALSRCARIRAIAHGGQTLLSRSVRDLVIDGLPESVELVDCGEHRLRDLGRPEQVFALAHPDLPGAAESLRSLDSLPNNLPSQLTSFVGRQRELTELREALDSTRLLTLTGAGGSGKTRLGLQLAAERLDGFADGAWWVELAPQTDPELVGDTIAKALGVRTLPGATALQSVCTHLAPRSVLIVLDNCEHLLEACAHAAIALLESGPDLKVLATSRAPLGLGGETDWRVPALSLPAAPASEPIDALTQSDAVQLFIERAVKVRPNFAVTNDNAPAVAQICSDLDGIPLALELAAARVRVLSVEQIAGGLADRFHLLTGGARAALPRQQTLRASVDWGYDLLSEQERILFGRLGVFVGGFTLDLAEEVCAGEALERYAVLDLLTALIEKSLVLAEERGPALRYQMLETIRQYAVERLEDASERDAVRDRHLGAMLALAERAAPNLETSRQATWLPILDLEAANIGAALERALERDIEGALRISVALTSYWKVRARYAHADRVLTTGIAAANDRWPDLRARALAAQAYLLLLSSNFTRVLATTQAAVELATDCGEQRTLARALTTAGEIHMFSDPLGARATLERAVALARQTDDEWSIAHATGELARSFLIQSRHREALETATTADPLFDRLGRNDIAWWRWYIDAWVHMDRAELPEYWTTAERALAAARESEDTTAEAIFLQMAAFVDTCEGHPELSIEKLEPMLRRMRERRVGYSLPLVIVWLARAESQVGALTQARERLERIVERGLDRGYLLAFACGVLGEVMRLQGDPAAAGTAQQGLGAARRLDSPAALYGPAICSAKLAVDSSDWAQADELLHEALSLCAERDLRIETPDLLDVLAEVARGLQSHDEAARLIGAVDASRAKLGLPVFASERPRREALIASVRQALGEDAFDRARIEGRAMDLEETVAYVRRARGERKRPPGGWEALTPTEQRNWNG